MDKPVQQEGSTHPDGETPPQVKKIRRQEIATLPQRKARRIKQALHHQARHLRDRDRGRASILRRSRKAFSAHSSGFFMELTALGDPIGIRMTIRR